jgi:hypothetical protein
MTPTHCSFSSYNESQRDALFLKFNFDKELYMFWTDLLSIIRSLNTVYTAIVIRYASYVDCLLVSGPGSVVGIATGYGLDGPEIESRWGRNFPHLPRPALGPTQPPVKWVPGLSQG